MSIPAAMRTRLQSFGALIQGQRAARRFGQSVDLGRPAPARPVRACSRRETHSSAWPVVRSASDPIAVVLALSIRDRPLSGRGRARSSAPAGRSAMLIMSRAPLRARACGQDGAARRQRQRGSASSSSRTPNTINRQTFGSAPGRTALATTVDRAESVRLRPAKSGGTCWIVQGTRQS
jgi:hypothetical protein